MVVTAASVQDRNGAKGVLEVLRHRFTRMRLIWADGAYAGDLAAQSSARHPGSWPNGIKLGKAKRGGYRKFRYLQFNNFAILTLFRA